MAPVWSQRYPRNVQGNIGAPSGETDPASTPSGKVAPPVEVAIRLDTRRGGEGGIRTHGPLQDTRFPVVPIRPLSHPSRATQANLWGAPVAPCGGRVLRNGSP